MSTASARKSKPLCAQQSLKTFLYYIEFSFSHPRSLQPGKRIVARCPKKCPTSTGCISETTLVLTAHFRVKRTTHGPIFNRVVEQKKRPTKTKLQNLPPPRCSVVITELRLVDRISFSSPGRHRLPPKSVRLLSVQSTRAPQLCELLQHAPVQSDTK